MQLTKAEEASLAMAKDVMDFYRRHHGQAVVEMKMDLLVEPIVIDIFDLTPNHRKDVCQHLMKVIVTMMMNVPIDDMVEEPASFKFILAGHFLQVLQHLRVREYDNG